MSEIATPMRHLPFIKKVMFFLLYVLSHIGRTVRKILIRLSIQECGTGLRVYGPVKISSHHNIIMGDRCALNYGVMLLARGGIKMGNDVVLSPYVMVTTDSLDNSVKVLPRPHISAPVVIKDGAWVGARAIILPGVTIGRNAIVAAGSIVREDVPENALVAGVPAKIKRTAES